MSRDVEAGALTALLAKKDYPKAIELIRNQLQQRGGTSRLRLQLADTLVLAGRGREAIPHLSALADDFARDGFAAKAIAVLKKIEKIDPGRRDIQPKLAWLIQEKHRSTSFTASRPAPMPEMGMEEIGIDAPSQAVEAAPAPIPPPPAAAPAAPPPPRAAAPAPVPPPAPKPDHDMDIEFDFTDELLGVLEETLQQRPSTETGGLEGLVSDRPAPAASPLFSDFSEEELLAVMGGLELLTFDSGDVIITQGEPGDSLFVLTTGTVKAFVKNPAGHHVFVREMGEGSFFGEISVLTGNPRTATITAATRCELLELDRVKLDAICQTRPRVRQVLQDFYSQRIQNK